MVKNFLKHLFIERKDQSWDTYNLIGGGLGFIPCPKCSKKIYELGISTLSLIKNRKCSVPFSSGAEWTESFVAQDEGRTETGQCWH
jgi:hypothetical protein